MPDYVVNKVMEALNSKGKAVNGSKILILGVSYKKNVDDLRETPSAVIMEKLQSRGAVIAYSDPHIPVFPQMRRHSFSLESLDLTPEVLGAHDCVVIATDHDRFDWELVATHARLIVDTRGVYSTKTNQIFRA